MINKSSLLSASCTLTFLEQDNTERTELPRVQASTQSFPDTDLLAQSSSSGKQSTREQDEWNSVDTWALESGCVQVLIL